MKDPSPDGRAARELFDGSGLQGWRMAGSGELALVDGALETRGGMGLLWYAEREFVDFVLEVQWRASRPSDNSGVFVRFPDPGSDPWVAVHEGYEIQILEEAPAADQRTGAVYRCSPPRDLPLLAPGEWHRLSVAARGQLYVVAVDGTVVNRYVGHRRRRGHVGLQNHDDDSRVQFRSVRVTPLMSGATPRPVRHSVPA